ncbi:hypothetical protein GCM10010468_41000 [Actinocorallia longicatena]|uniref:Uncharacterized protein n=1 Tax=Actinocorallia longicatena TaxID=111803 RepID=A0ABP6QEE2_9ACTN
MGGTTRAGGTAVGAAVARGTAAVLFPAAEGVGGDAARAGPSAPPQATAQARTAASGGTSFMVTTDRLV